MHAWDGTTLNVTQPISIIFGWKNVLKQKLPGGRIYLPDAISYKRSRKCVPVKIVQCVSNKYIECRYNISMYMLAVEVGM